MDLTFAVLTTFRDYGARQNRQKARMMWLVEQMGVETFREEVARRTVAGKLERAVPDMIDKSWERRSYFGVHKQKQEGLNWVGCNVPVGRMVVRRAGPAPPALPDCPPPSLFPPSSAATLFPALHSLSAARPSFVTPQPEDMIAIGDIAEKYGSGEIRLTVEQNVIFANIPDDKIEAMLREPLLQKFTPFPGRVMAGLVACTGAQFCGFAQVETKRNAWQARLEQLLAPP